MFYDERIHAGRGKAFRKTLIFATLIFALYSVCHTVYDYLMLSRFSFLSVSIEYLYTLTGLAIILYGELTFITDIKDEMHEYRKNCYYAKAFFIFLYFIAGIFCVIAPLDALLLDSNDYPPNTVLFLAEIPCWLFLLLQFKRDEMPMNSEFLSDEKRGYLKHVFVNILKFGGVCAGFTCVGFMVSMFYIAMIRMDMGLFDFAFLTSVILSGLISWISFSLEYLLFSLAERVSDKAKQKGRISWITTLFMIIGYGVSIILTLLPALLSLFGYEINSSASVILISYANNYLGWISTYCTGIFTVYFLSELYPLKDKKLKGSLSGSLIVSLIGFVFSILITMLRSDVLMRIMRLFDPYSNKYEEAIRFTMMFSGVYNIIMASLSLFFAIHELYFLSKHDIAKTYYIAVPIVSFSSAIIHIFLSSILQINILSDFFSVISVLCGAGMMVIYLMIRKRINNNPMDI